MARSFANVKIISAFVADKVSVVATRKRGYAAAASQGVVSSSVSGGRIRAKMNLMLKKGGGEECSNVTTSWVPDPVTGYYRPERHANEIDPADLRNMLLNHKH